MFAFALAQPYLWLAVFELFGLPQYAVMAASVPVKSEHAQNHSPYQRYS
jgi:hypothetical protein